MWILIPRNYWFLLRSDDVVVILRNGINPIYQRQDVKSGTSKSLKAGSQGSWTGRQDGHGGGC